MFGVGHPRLQYISPWDETPKQEQPISSSCNAYLGILFSLISISSMAAVAGPQPLAMSQTKDDLLKHLNMGPETYAMMAVSFACS